ncbi:hypothetical protein B6U90_04815 [Thermoplasmatales archaeon ex4484_6]|nr:MAG: hypothetical protein B6U90_04815 [Thermoplasmatales archaeon ex4484_6]RLF65975.1 MAG: hypothetical protein DRN57_08010 [Thermoplasmata archaeon]
MNRSRIRPLHLVPSISLLLSGVIFTLIFGSFGSIEDWVMKGLGFVPFPVWFLSGAILSIGGHQIWKRWPVGTMKFVRRSFLILLGYIGIAVFVAVLTGEGEGMERITSSDPVRIWGILAWFIIASAPSFMGVLGIITRSRWARGGMALSYAILAASCMIYPQARSATIIGQDPLLSILFVWSIMIYMEGSNWIARYENENTPGRGPLLRRQVTFTILFLAVGSLVAYIPFMWGEGRFGIYEESTILGKALIGAVVLVPISLFALSKGFLDRRAKNG